MKRKTKNEKAAEEIIHAIRVHNRVSNNSCMSGISDDTLKDIVLSVLKLWYKPVPYKKKDDSWKAMRDQCS